jgi:glycosyltransferase 2 family protein
MFQGNKLRLLTGFSISLLCLYLAFRGTNPAEILTIVSGIKLGYLLPAVTLLLVAFVIRAIRWKCLLSPVKTIDINSLFSSTMIGFMANNVLPFRVGEIVRAYAISKNARISLSSSVASLVVERVFDGMVISGFMLFLLMFISLPPWMVKVNYLLLSFYVISIAAAIFLVWGLGKNSGWLSNPRWEKVVCNFTAGLQVCTDGKLIFWTGSLSVAHWLVIAGYYYFVFMACGFSLSFLAASALVAIVAIGIMLPAAPGFVGNFQYFTVVGLSLFGVSREEALAYSLVAHAGQFVPVTIVGLVYFFRQSVRFAELRTPEQQVI